MKVGEPGGCRSLTYLNLPPIFFRTWSRTLPWRSTSCIRYGRAMSMYASCAVRPIIGLSNLPIFRQFRKCFFDLEPRPDLAAVDQLRLWHAAVVDHLVEQRRADPNVLGRLD